MTSSGTTCNWRRWAAAFAVLVAKLAASDAREMDVLKVFNPSTETTDVIVTSVASFGAALPRSRSSNSPLNQLLQLRPAQVDANCDVHVVPSSSSLTSSKSSLVAFLMDRTGQCSFVQMVFAAQQHGAAMVIVRDTLQGVLHAASVASGGTSIESAYDCLLGNGFVSDNSSFPVVRNPLEALDCASSSSCGSNTCVLTGNPSRLLPQQFEVCCVKNVLVQMQIDPQHRALASQIHIPAVFVTLRDGGFLAKLVAQANTKASIENTSVDPDSVVLVQAANAEANPWNVSMFLTWALGLLAVMGGAYYAARDERYFSYEQVASSCCVLTQEERQEERKRSGYVSIGSDNESESDDDRITLSTKHACYFLVAASSSLLLIYYVHLTSLLNLFFVVGSSLAFTQVISLPLFSCLLPPRYAFGAVHIALSFASAVAVAVFWYHERFSTAIWPLQDLLCICLCFVFIDTVQIPSFRVACYLLLVAFAYDVFFVFFSPLVFGSNVMVAVASGGAKVRACEYGSRDCEQHERLPMVLSIPLFFTSDAGDALLGLGDLVVPGLLVAFCIRFDYCMGFPLSRHYYCVSSCSYGVGLLLANIMAILLRDFVAGQPALMYIVPVMLGSVALFAASRQELQTLWEGPAFMMELPPVVHHGSAVVVGASKPASDAFGGGVALDHSVDVDRNEKQPFLPRDQV